jgi:hypothetical protein
VRVLILWLTLVASAAPAGSQGLPTAAPEAVGFSSEFRDLVYQAVIAPPEGLGEQDAARSVQ